jgi:hypothetical protein
MQSSRFNQGFALPVVPLPADTVCFSIPIPNDPAYIKAFYGVMYDMSVWISWQRDAAHTGAVAAGRMKTVYEHLVAGDYTGCSPKQVNITSEDNNEMTVTRIVCEGDQAFFEVQVCACPETWLRLANSTQVVAPGQPCSGQTTPPPGQTSQSCVTIPANGQILLPYLVSSGDTITLDACKGSWWDGTENDFGPLYRFGANGDQMFAGVDNGFPRTDAGDFLPAANHMKVIAAIGSTPTYLELTVGVAVTVPGGISAQQLVVIPNRSAALRLGSVGECQACVTVKNNQATSFTHTLDFTASRLGFVPTTTGGSPDAVWVGGQGWSFVDHSGLPQTIRLVSGSITLPARTINMINMVMDYANGPNDGNVSVPLQVLSTNIGTLINNTAGSGPTGSGILVTSAITQVGVTNISVELVCGDTFVAIGGNAVLKQLIVSGLGADPF